MSATCNKAEWDKWLDRVAASLIRLAGRNGEETPDGILEYSRLLLTDQEMTFDKSVLLRVQSKLGLG